ncbi:hypothetical protein ACVBEF_01240 [Glaciimonas sp. GG7]
MKTTSTAQRSPKNSLTQPLGIRLKPEEQALVEQYAADEYLSRASFLRRMVLRGLQQYQRELASNS